jgi:DNA modification methylase
MNDLQLLKGDCLDLMPWLVSDESVDLTVTSPPYDSLRAYEGLPFEKFKKVAEELYRVTKKGGVVVWVVGDATVKGSETGTSFRQALYFKECGFNLHDTMIWHKGSAPFQHANRYIQSCEWMFVLSKGRPKTANLIRDRKNKWGGTQVHGTERQSDNSVKPLRSKQKSKVVREFGARFCVWDISSEKCAIRKLHPATFPEMLAHDHILSWSNPGDTVFDPFLGSGTTGKMAFTLKRKFIGIEKEEEYFEIAKKRIGASK